MFLHRRLKGKRPRKRAVLVWQDSKAELLVGSYRTCVLIQFFLQLQQLP
jgi:hypothetical protein